MATVKEHYAELLSDLYSWMYGGFEIGIQCNVECMNKHQLIPKGSGVDTIVENGLVTIISSK